ncbi:hypothetical protein [Corynebacterium kalidii]|uniref:Uncharacterized protein n=1 Tax=Corynebacterium kalidii TaxID=2931982 RepID=A0A9X2AYN6_9CORY|nr:hypothetical protein [Corynebacterium kalidii]MCJ7857682.1 hypothetical protein [Corynebacterium kalidii]
MYTLPIPTEDIRASLLAYDPATSEHDLCGYEKQMADHYNALVTVQHMSVGRAEQVVRALYLEELNAAVAQRERKEPVKEATWEEFEALTYTDIMNGAGCDSYEEFEQRYAKWL